MNKANKNNPIDIIFVRILIYTKVMKNAFSKLQSAGYRFVEQLKVENEEIKKERVVLTRSP